MSLEVRYEAGVSATYEDITDRVRVGSLDVTQNAEEGSVAMSTITIDDPDGDYEIKGYRRIAIYETEGEEDVSQLTYNGFIVDRKIIRGPYRTGAGRQWVCTVVDTNCLLEFRLMTGEDADRPAETTAERLDWLLGESEMDRIPNHDYVNLTDGIVAMDAADYRGQRAVDVINDIAQASGMNYFAFCTDETAAPIPAAPGKTTMWYDFADSAEYVSTLSLSNDLADVLADPGVCFEISMDTELIRDPARVYSGAYVRYDGGEEYEEDTDISNEFTRRDAVVPAENVKSSAKATARALRYLADMDTEEDRITTAVLLPAAKVNLIREGMSIPFKATHFPEEYRVFRLQRVLQRKVKQLTEEFYLVTLTLGWGPSWPPPTAGEPDILFEICNNLPTTRTASSGAEGTDNVSGNWYWEMENYTHYIGAYTEDLNIHYSTPAAAHIDLLAAMGIPDDGSSQGNPSSGYAPLPNSSGTFTIPAGCTGFSFYASGQGYSFPFSIGNDCWRLRLWRI